MKISKSSKNDIFLELKNKFLSNKKAEEGATGATGSLIIALIIMAVLIIFVALWWSGLFSYVVKIGKSFFKSLK